MKNTLEGLDRAFKLGIGVGLGIGAILGLWLGILTTIMAIR